MPIPEPQAGESQDDFISRCHGALSSEFPDEAQRNAVCFDAWRGKTDQQERGRTKMANELEFSQKVREALWAVKEEMSYAEATGQGDGFYENTAGNVGGPGGVPGAPTPECPEGMMWDDHRGTCVKDGYGLDPLIESPAPDAA